MRILQRSSILAVVMVVVVLSSSLAVFANNLEGQLQDIQMQMSEERSRAEKAGQQVETISEQLRALQAELDKATKEYEAIKKELDDTETKIEKNTVLLEQAERSLAKRMDVLNKRIRDIYKNGQISYIDVLFGARDFSDFMTRMDLLKRIIKFDYDLIVKIKEERAAILARRAELEQDKLAIERLAAEAEDKRNEVEVKTANKQELLDSAVNDRDMAERAYQELLAASAQVEAMIRQSMYRPPSGSGGMYSGRMIWPIYGEVTSEFGWRTHPIFGTSKYHSGMDIAGDYGLPVVAAASGVVIHAGWISGYGNTVIIDHGGSVSTLYGHNDSLAVFEGQSVSQGQLIAYCGSTGYSTGPHVHFEVRENGSPVSPYNYL